MRWATTDPQSPSAPQADYVEESRDQLGDELVSLVNRFRLNGLKSQNGNPNPLIFQAGTNTMDVLIGAIPAFAHAVARQSAGEQVGLKSSSAAFDDYAARVTALRRINHAIATYLNIGCSTKCLSLKELRPSVLSRLGERKNLHMTLQINFPSPSIWRCASAPESYRWTQSPITILKLASLTAGTMLRPARCTKPYWTVILVNRQPLHFAILRPPTKRSSI